MTINKSQGQTLHTVSLDLQCLVFTHRQLYIVLSRATNVTNLTILLPEAAGEKTTNIMYPEVLQHIRKNTKIADFIAGYKKIQMLI